MEKTIYVVSIVFLFAGCSSIQTIKQDYLKVDEYNEFSWGEAFDTLKRDYWGYDDLDTNTRRKAELMAYDKIITTKYKEDYEVLRPTIDDYTLMSEAYPYIFIHFFPRKEKKELTPSTYLVVISRFHKRIMYAGMFTPPEGDPMYRYHEILKEIQR